MPRREKYEGGGLKHGGKNTREGDKSGVWHLERMKRGSGISLKSPTRREDKSSGIEILKSETFAKINPPEPLRLAKQVERRKRNWPDSGNSLVRADTSRWSWKNRRRLKRLKCRLWRYYFFSLSRVANGQRKSNPVTIDGVSSSTWVNACSRSLRLTCHLLSHHFEMPVLETVIPVILHCELLFRES